MEFVNLILKYVGQENKYSEAENLRKNTKFVEQVERWRQQIFAGILDYLVMQVKFKDGYCFCLKNAPKILTKLELWMSLMALLIQLLFIEKNQIRNLRKAQNNAGFECRWSY